jgi:hypothetical protein
MRASIFIRACRPRSRGLTLDCLPFLPPPCRLLRLAGLVSQMAGQKRRFRRARTASAAHPRVTTSLLCALKGKRPPTEGGNGKSKYHKCRAVALTSRPFQLSGPGSMKNGSAAKITIPCSKCAKELKESAQKIRGGATSPCLQSGETITFDRSSPDASIRKL